MDGDGVREGNGCAQFATHIWNSVHNFLIWTLTFSGMIPRIHVLDIWPRFNTHLIKATFAMKHHST